MIVPVYKVEKYLDRCVQSIISQTYTNLEIILVDDGSPDACPAMCESWAHKDPRIRVIHQQNSGLSAARNAGIDAANGKYLAFVDSDDYILPQMYATLLKLLIDNDADISVCSYQKVSEEGMPVHEKNYKELAPKVLVGGEILTEWVNNEWSYVLVVTKLCRAKLFAELRFPEGRLNEDEYVAHHLLGSCRKSASTSDRMYMYTQRNDSIMGKAHNSFTQKRIHDVMFAYRDRYHFFVEIGRPDLAGQAAGTCCRFIRSELKRASYLKNFRLFNQEIAFCIKISLNSRGLKPKLRLVKMLLFIPYSIAREFCLLLLGKSA